MPTWLIGLIATVCVLAIIAFLYMIIAFRKINIVSKKLDYLVEDLTYKSEKLNSMVEAIVKISSYVDVAETLLKKNSEAISSFIKRNKKDVDIYKNQLNKSLENYMEEKDSKRHENS
ncbi:hypothetical protein [Ureaplasma ceti]|uniref:DUF948 domain-containing protein n=1 Tax=Ureaplasma ceti TaxID=3119530 RepID=A0ABP9U9Z2_9BACT